jgi:hypothetical protein
LLAPTLAAHKLGGSAELYATGWSRRRDAIESWVIPFCGLDDRAELKMVDDPLGCMNPQPSQEAIESVGWCVPTGDSFDPLKDGLMLMEAQRRTPVDRGPLSVERDASQMVYGVGGFIQHTVITRLSIRSSVIHRWADEIGKAIDPVCSARSMRAAERTSRYSC